MNKKIKIPLCEIIKQVFVELFKLEPQEQIPIFVFKDDYCYMYRLGGPDCGTNYPLTKAKEFYNHVALEMVKKGTTILINKPFDDSHKPLSVDEMTLLYAKITTKH